MTRPVSKERSRTATHRPAPQPRRSARARRVVRALLLVFAAVVMVDALVGERGLLAMRRARDEHDRVAAQIARLRADNERLRQQVRRLTDDPAAIEEIARRELGLIRPGEKVFIIRDLPPPAAP
jgi:cell division protein FtsB